MVESHNAAAAKFHVALGECVDVLAALKKESHDLCIPFENGGVVIWLPYPYRTPLFIIVLGLGLSSSWNRSNFSLLGDVLQLGPGSLGDGAKILPLDTMIQG